VFSVGTHPAFLCFWIQQRLRTLKHLDSFGHRTFP
jgi:hypothetical protein